MKYLKVEKLTNQSFAPYGRVIGHPETEPTKAGEGWSCYSPMDFVQAAGMMGIGVVYCESCPPQIKSMERHVSREEVLWTAEQDVIMFVDIPVYLGNSDAQPNPDTTKAFCIPAGTVVVISRGTWHSPGFGVGGKARYYFMVEIKKDFIDQDAQPWIPFIKEETVALEG